MLSDLACVIRGDAGVKNSGRAQAPLAAITVGEIRDGTAANRALPTRVCLGLSSAGPEESSQDYFQAGGGSGSADPSARASEPA
jgi:hypothetical protein